MRVMVLVKASKDSEQGMEPMPETRRRLTVTGVLR